MSNKESELNNAILLYICECKVSGDVMALQALGIPNEIQDRLRTMTIQEVLHTSNIRSSFIKSIQIDSVILGNLLNRATEEKRSQHVLDRLIAHGAPLQLVRDLEGINALEFSAMRKMQKIDIRGRTQQPTPNEVTIIFNACKELGINAADSTALSGQQWIEIAKKTNLAIRLIYKVICESEEITGERCN